MVFIAGVLLAALFTLAGYIYGRCSERARCNRELNKAIKNGKLIIRKEAGELIFQANKSTAELIEGSLPCSEN